MLLPHRENKASNTLLRNTKRKETKEVRAEVILHQGLHLVCTSLVQGPVILGVVPYQPTAVLWLRISAPTRTFLQ